MTKNPEAFIFPNNETALCGPPAPAKLINYGYNLDGSLQYLTTPPLKTVVYSYNGAGRPIKGIDSIDGINFVTGATYAPQGALAGMTMGQASGFAGFTVSNTYNDRLQPTLLSAISPTGTVFSDSYNFHLGAGDNGNVYQIVNNRDNTRSQNFLYDSLNRIQQANSSGTQWGETFGIDAWGNMTNEAPVAGKTLHEGLSTSAGTNNQLAGFGYDSAGNMTSNGSNSYVYDAENHLIWTTGIVSNDKYVYDGNGERVEKCVAATSATACPTSGTNGTLYWKGTGSDTLDESDLSGNAQEEYVFFGGQRVARRDVTASGATIAVHYYFSDHLGSHGVVENATGTACEQDIDYYPYGGVEHDYCPNVAQNYKFTAKERDAESSLDNFGARFDASSLGRFMSPDPLGGHQADPQTLNKYAYVDNNPLNLTDPTGLDFNLTCSGKDTATCNGGVQGITTTTTDAKGNQTSTFTATQIGDDGNGGLVDKTTNTGAYTASVGQNGVSFSQDGGKPSAGVFANGTDPTHIQGSGDLAGFSFTFTNSKMEANQTAAGTFTFAGTPDQAGAALQKAGFSYHSVGENSGMNEYRSPGSFWTGANSGHFNLYQLNLKPGLGVPEAQGDMHFGEHNFGLNPISDILHCVADRAGLCGN